MKLASVFLSVVTITSLTICGCGKSSNQSAAGGAATTQTSAEGHSHEGWWCDEHGLPEEKCAMCNLKLSAEMKAKGDWCAKHDRPDSVCFVCHPELEANYIALYEAKYGKKPPARKE